MGKIKILLNIPVNVSPDKRQITYKSYIKKTEDSHLQLSKYSGLKWKENQFIYISSFNDGMLSINNNWV